MTNTEAKSREEKFDEIAKLYSPVLEALIVSGDRASEIIDAITTLPISSKTLGEIRGERQPCAHLMEHLKAAGINIVTINYDWSRRISRISASFADGRPDRDLLDDEVVESGQEQLVERLEDFAWKVLNRHRPGFEINDAGYGQITIDAEEGTFAIKHTEPVDVPSDVEV